MTIHDAINEYLKQCEARKLSWSTLKAYRCDLEILDRSQRHTELLDIEPREEEPESLTVVIVKKGDSQVGLVVDDLMGQQEIVIKSLGKYINGNKLISGATILGDGEVALILDANTLM